MNLDIWHTPSEWSQMETPFKVRLVELPQISDENWERMATEQEQQWAQK